MSIFTVVAPINISKYVMDLFIFERSGEEGLLRILFRMLKHVEERCLEMEEDPLFLYIKSGAFIEDCFRELTLSDIFK